MKNANLINQIGESLAEKYNVKYLSSDFKKKEGYKKHPTERLRIIKKGNGFQFYKIEKGKKSIYLSKKNLNEIKRLAQKSYEKKVVSKIQRQIKLIKSKALNSGGLLRAIERNVSSYI